MMNPPNIQSAYPAGTSGWPGSTSTAYPGWQQQMGSAMPTGQQGMQLPAGSTIGQNGTVGPASIPAPGTYVPGQLPMQQSYIENILRLNLGKVGTFYMTYENNSEWNAKVFRGRVEAAGRDHIIISDPQTGVRTILLMVNLDYATFEGELNYFYPTQFGGVGSVPLSTR